MTGSDFRKVRSDWSVSLLLAASLALIALIPQLSLLLIRREAWAGSYVSNDFDERAYSAYLGALIDGQPRLNDPFTGTSGSTASPQAETLFSIQFIPAYLLAVPARVFGLSASTMMIALRPLVAFFSSLTIFWIFSLVGLNKTCSALATAAVLCLPSFSLSSFEFHQYFLRGYVPSLPFPIFLVFCGLGWKAMTASVKSKAVIFAFIQGICFVVLIYSYFFLWTAAAGWYCAFAAACLLFDPLRFRQRLTAMAITSSIAVFGLVPFLVLLSRRAANMDAAQLLVSTRSPDLWHISELICAALVIAVFVNSSKRRNTVPPDLVAFAISFAVLPFLLFNEQTITGRSLQPLHYERYVVPYVVLIAIAAVVHAFLGSKIQFKLRSTRVRRMVGALTVIVLIVSAFAAAVSASRQRRNSIGADENWLTLIKTCEVVRRFPVGRGVPTVFYTNLAQSDFSPTTGAGPVLWSDHMFVFSGASAAENIQRLYAFLYYSGVSGSEFRSMAGSNSYLSLALFGFERVDRRDRGQSEAISADEMGMRQREYESFINSFTLDTANSLHIDFVVTPSEFGPDISTVDRWYERELVGVAGGYSIYKLTARSRKEKEQISRR